jgi:Na+/pantothenate symporter
MFTFSGVLVFVNLMFLMLGAVLYIYSQSKGLTIPAKTDNLFPFIALNQLGAFAGIIFIIGLISAAYPSADGALTSLTTSVCVDFLGLPTHKTYTEEKKTRVRKLVHLSFAVLLLLVIVFFRIINNEAVISKLFTIAGYTYGPLLGLYAFGLFNKRPVKDALVPYICVASPLICYVLSEHSEIWLGGYKFGFELLLLNGFITYLGLLFISNKSKLIIK